MSGIDPAGALRRGRSQLAAIAALLVVALIAVPALRAAPSPRNVSAPTVAGEGRPGQAVHCGPGVWDAPADAPYAYTYRWLRVVNGTATPIDGATGPDYVVQLADRGVDNGITGVRCEVRADGATTALSPIVAVRFPVAAIRPGVTGTARPGRTLTCDGGEWDDRVGSRYARSFSWLRLDNGQATVLAGETGSTYTVRVADRIGVDNGINGVACRVAADGASPATSRVVFVPGPRNLSSPEVSGDRAVGRDLTCSTGSWDDPTGDPYGFEFQWQRLDNGTATDIPGATARTYTVTPADRIGVANGINGVRCRVVADRDQTPAGDVHRADSDVVFIPGPINRIAPQVTGDRRVGRTLTCSTGDWTELDRDRYALGFQWERMVNGTRSAIAGATDATYVVRNADRVGVANGISGLQCRVTAPGAPEARSAVVFIPGPRALAPPQVSGDRRVGRVLRCSPGSWDDEPGEPYAFTFQWERMDNGNVTAISGATAATYTVQGDDRVGVDNGINGVRCVVFADRDRLPADAPASSTSNLRFIPGPRNLQLPQVVGDAKIGRELRCEPGAWDDRDADPYAMDYAWERVDNGTATRIPGATSSTYVVQAADRVGVDNGINGVRCVAFADRALLTRGPISATAPLRFVPAPANLGAPALDGDPYVGQTLACGRGRWDDRGGSRYPIAFAWTRDGAAIAGQDRPAYTTVTEDLGHVVACQASVGPFAPTASAGMVITTGAPAAGTVPVNLRQPQVEGDPRLRQTVTCTRGGWDDAPGARYAMSYRWLRGGTTQVGTGADYVVTPADRGSTLVCEATASSPSGSAARTAPAVTVTDPAIQGAPAITGRAVLGGVLTCGRGAWDDSDTAPYAVSYRWTRYGQDVGGETAARHTVTSDDLNTPLRCVVTAEGVTTAGSDTIYPTVPDALVRPAITGRAKIGQTLQCDLGTWDEGDAAPYAKARQWLRYGSAIDGATGMTYVVRPDDVNTPISCMVRAAGATSAFSDTVYPTGPVNDVAPALGGTPRLGQTLTCGRGTWNDEAGIRYPVTYRWTRYGTDIAGATTTTYVVTPGDFNTPIRCVVRAYGVDAWSDTVYPEAPVVQVAPSADGEARLGHTLTCSRGTWNDEPGARYDVAYRWTRYGATVATGAEYVITKADIGTPLACVVRAQDSADAGSRTLYPLGVANVHPPVLSGTPRLGGTLRCDRGTWNDSAERRYDVTHVWTRYGATIATGAEYTVTAADLNTPIACVVRAEDAATSSSDTVYPYGPEVRSPPSIDGARRIGGELRCVPGAANDTGDGTWTTQTTWLVDGAATPTEGRAPDRFLVRRTDVGRRVSCRVRYQDRVDATSGAVDIVAPQVREAPAIAGLALVRRELRCSRGSWDDGGAAPYAVTYAWQRDGAAIRDADGPTYAPGVADVGRALTCVVRAEQLTSAESPVVRPAWLPLRTTLTPDATSKAPGATGAYTVRVANPNPASSTIARVELRLPAGVTPRAATTTGLTTADPYVSDRTLTWYLSPAVELPADGEVTLSTGVTFPAAPGELLAAAAVDATGGMPAPATGDAARVTVEDASSTAGCTIVGTAGDDVLVGTEGDDVICGLGGDDRLEGRGGDDVLRGGEGNDVLVGGPGADRLSGGPGYDIVSYSGRDEPVTVTIGDGANDGAAGEADDVLADVEEVRGGRGADRLVGDDGANVLRGLGGTDTLVGRGGEDVLDGGEGADVLDGRDGIFDQILCGAGNDRALVDPPDRTVGCESLEYTTGG